MNTNEKLLRLLEMQEHPERYTDDELCQLMADEEYRQLYEQMVRATDAMYAEKHQANNGDRSWKSALNHGSVISKIAAMFIGLLMLSGIAYAAVQMVRQTQQQVQTETTTSVAGSSQSAHDTRIDEDDSAQNKPLLYEDAELAKILSDIATFHQLEPVYKNEECKHIRLYFTWDRRSSIDDIINTFNKFERIHITRDNKKLIVE